MVWLGEIFLIHLIGMEWRKWIKDCTRLFEDALPRAMKRGANGCSTFRGKFDRGEFVWHIVADVHQS